MTTNNTHFSIKSSIQFQFDNSQLRDMAYNSYLPEIKKLQTKRSKVIMEKNSNLLLFDVECTDITAFRASISDIVSLGKIIEATKKLCTPSES